METQVRQHEAQFKTYDEMIAFLRQGRDAEGRPLDIENFDSVSPKKLAQLFEEQKNREVTLELRNGRICRLALTVKIILFAEGYMLKEKYRKYNGVEVVKNDPESYSETVIRGEDLFEAVKRGTWEEIGVRVDKSQIYFDSYTKPEKSAPYESRAYKGLQTIAHVVRFIVSLVERPWTERERMINDVGAEVCVVWVNVLRSFNKKHNRVLSRLKKALLKCA